MQAEKVTDYTQFHEISTLIAGKVLVYITKPGIENWNDIKPFEFLIAEHTAFPQKSNVLLFGSRHGAIAAALALANPDINFTSVETNWISIVSQQRTFAKNSLSNIRIHQYPIEQPLSKNSYQAAIILIPKGRGLARRWILEAFHSLEPGGVLFIGGANDAGVQSIIKDAGELFDNGEVLAYKKGERIARFSEKKEYLPAWTETNGIAPGTWFELDLDVGGDKYLIHSMPGVFSSAHIDEGSQLLLNNITVPPYARVLDVGCGYGIIGMSAARKQDTCEVEMIDVDLLSVASCSKNIHLNGLSNATVTASDLLSACDDKPYQVILSNPPFHAGKETNYLISEAMIKQAYHNLVPGGEFTLVANRFLRYEKQMEKYFSKVFIKAQTSKFHVITGVR